jgi:transposase
MATKTKLKSPAKKQVKKEVKNVTIKKAVAKKAALKKAIEKPSKKNYADLKHKAESLYMDTQLSQKEIGNMLGVSEITISNWANATQPTWDEIRKLKSIGRPQALAKLYARIIEQIEKGENSDSIHKTHLIIKDFEDKRIALPEMINTLREFITHLMGEELELAKTLTPYVTAFINKKVNERKQ